MSPNIPIIATESLEMTFSDTNLEVTIRSFLNSHLEPLRSSQELFAKYLKSGENCIFPKLMVDYVQNICYNAVMKNTNAWINYVEKLQKIGIHVMHRYTDGYRTAKREAEGMSARQLIAAEDYARFIYSVSTPESNLDYRQGRIDAFADALKEVDDE